MANPLFCVDHHCGQLTLKPYILDKTWCKDNGVPDVINLVFKNLKIVFVDAEGGVIPNKQTNVSNQILKKGNKGGPNLCHFFGIDALEPFCIMPYNA